MGQVIQTQSYTVGKSTKGTHVMVDVDNENGVSVIAIEAMGYPGGSGFKVSLNATIDQAKQIIDALQTALAMVERTH